MKKVQDAPKNETPNVAGLESAPISKHADVSKATKFDDLVFLQTTDPALFHNDVNVSSKYDKEREDKTQSGLAILAKIQIEGVQINPLLILLGLWWEVKPARAAIKSMIDAEAEAKGYPSDVYLQEQLGEQVDQFTNLQSAIDRVRYAKTYFKPRKPLSTAIPTKSVKIDGKVYEVAIAVLEQAKITFGTDAEGLRNHILEVATPVTIEIDEL